MTPHPKVAPGRADWIRHNPWIALIVVPAVALIARSAWSIERSLEPGVVPGFAAEGADESAAQLIAPGQSLDIELPELSGEWHVELQASASAELELRAVGAGRREDLLWRVPEIPNQQGLRTRSTLLTPPAGIETLRVVSSLPDREVRIAGLRISRRPWILPQWVLIPLLWGAWLVVRRTSWLRRWVRADPWIAAVLLFQALFHWRPLPRALPMLVLGLWLPLALLRRWSARAPIAAVTTALAAVVTLGLGLPAGLRLAVERSVSRQHELTVDHRMRPDGGEVNADGIRFRGAAADLGDDDLVVLFLGDSFTYGLGLPYEQSYPYAFEALAADAGCRPAVRAVNVGWTSASPLLALRWLREHGAGYRPDLVLYNLDVTDFYDDLAYEQQLRRGDDLHVDPLRVLGHWVRPWMPDALQAEDAPRFVRRRPDLDDFRHELQPPRDRFFVTAQPLEASRARIEAGVVRNLAEIDRWSREVAGARMALVLYPRAYQYSERESPDNWEAAWYQALGPYVQEPFRYFAETRARLPYPVLDVREDFAGAAAFPLFAVDDPHWTSAGAQVAARGVLGRLQAAGLVACASTLR